MTEVKRALSMLAAFGLVVSFGVHALTYVAPARLEGQSWTWLLHAGIFVVFVPAVLWQRSGLQDGERNILAGAPAWMRVTLGVTFAYALVNFVVFLFLQDGVPTDQGDGTYALLNHGRFIRELTRREYVVALARVQRGFSGHWMAFYAAAMTILEAAASRGEPRG